MKKGKVIPGNKKQPKSKNFVLLPEEKKRLADFFSLLIAIDRRENVTKFYDKPIN